MKTLKYGNNIISLMEELKDVGEIDSAVLRNPNSILVVIQDNCPWCKKTLEELKKLEKDGISVYTINIEKAMGLAKKLGIKGTPFTIAFKECEIGKAFEGYDPNAINELQVLYKDAEPVCKVNLSESLFETILGEPIIL